MRERFAVVVVQPPGYAHSAAFQEVAETLVHALRALGQEAEVTAAPRPGARSIVLGSNLLEAHPLPLETGAILYNLEQLDAASTWLTPGLLALFRAHPTWEYSARNARRHSELGLPSPTLVPIGWVPELARIAPTDVEDIDVLFYGSMNPRRRAVLDALAARGLAVHAAFGVYGEERDRLIARSKLVLNVHYYEAKVFEAVRVSYLLANRRCVVSERGPDDEEERAFEGGVSFAAYDELVERCVALCRDGSARRAISEEGFRRMRARDARDFVSRALSLPRPSEVPGAPADADGRTSPDARPGSGATRVVPARPASRPRLSLCMIARDEEAMLPGCLASVRGIVDEVVLVDTGSVDRTREIAREAGATVLERPWDADFSAPRNLALERARGLWVLVLDADERLAPGAGAALNAALAGADFDAGFLRLHHAARLDATPAEILDGRSRRGEPVPLPRLLRNVDGLRYEGSIHESVASWFQRRGSRGRTLDVDVVHLGDVPEVRDARRKRERNLALLRARIESAPHDLDAPGYLALELLDLGRTDEAADVAERAWSRVHAAAPEHDLVVRRLAVARSVAALHRADVRRVRESVAVAARTGEHPDLVFLEACCLELEAQAAPAGRDALLARAAHAHADALARVRRGGTGLVFYAHRTNVLMRLGHVELERGCAAEATALFEEARAAGVGPAADLGLAEVRLRSGQAAAALQLLEPLLGTGPDAWALGAEAALALGATSDARLLARRAREREPAGYVAGHRRRALEVSGLLP